MNLKTHTRFGMKVVLDVTVIMIKMKTIEKTAIPMFVILSACLFVLLALF